MAATAPASPPADDTPEKRKARIEGIRKLIQQASSKEGDGQVAAWRVCALIRKFGLDIIDPSLLNEVYTENHRLKAQLDVVKAGGALPDDAEDDLFAGGKPIFGGTTQAKPWKPWQKPQPTGTANTANAPWNPPPQPPPTPQPQPGWGAQAAAQPMTAPVFVQAAKFTARCKQCSKVLNVGEPLRWIQGKGVWCPTTSCYNDWANGQQQAANFNPFGP